VGIFIENGLYSLKHPFPDAAIRMKNEDDIPAALIDSLFDLITAAPLSRDDMGSQFLGQGPGLILRTAVHNDGFNEVCLLLYGFDSLFNDFFLIESGDDNGKPGYRPKGGMSRLKPRLDQSHNQ
jgi:hypothetical protein